MRLQISVTALVLVSIFSCQISKEKQPQATEPIKTESLSTSILGTWENVSMSVTVNSANNTDSTKTDYIPREEWEERLGIKPIKTTYSKDGKFISEYRDLSDSLVNRSEGLWVMTGDSLALTSDQVTTMYHFEYKSDSAVFTGYLDWDSDGKPDDLYVGVQRKL